MSLFAWLFTYISKRFRSTICLLPQVMSMHNIEMDLYIVDIEHYTHFMKSLSCWNNLEYLRPRLRSTSNICFIRYLLYQNLNFIFFTNIIKCTI